MRKFVSALAVVFLSALPAHAENWIKVHGEFYIDSESLFTDSAGFTLFKTRELTNTGSVMHQHKEAIHCGNSRHYFRGMYGATAAVNNSDDADLTWNDWKTNPREVYNIDRLYALKTTVCRLKK